MPPVTGNKSGPIAAEGRLWQPLHLIRRQASHSSGAIPLPTESINQVDQKVILSLIGSLAKHTMGSVGMDQCLPPRTPFHEDPKLLLQTTSIVSPRRAAAPIYFCRHLFNKWIGLPNRALRFPHTFSAPMRSPPPVRKGNFFFLLDFRCPSGGSYCL